ncbi:hypothetical protein GQ607_000412 [Colletotrichum asianum]|uniref:Uncharacterized protein n=1 Tax=Colletotrichum asianum TaxID=702518 RepID=A0A8H3ZXW4_9PEZI|nr:hypothetical protein GQ607_000412 [Colletotrichum asianum]
MPGLRSLAVNCHVPIKPGDVEKGRSEPTWARPGEQPVPFNEVYPDPRELLATCWCCYCWRRCIIPSSAVHSSRSGQLSKVPKVGNYCQHHPAPQQHLFPSSGHHARTPKRYLPTLPILHPLTRASFTAAATAAATDSNSAIAGPPVPQLVLVIS